MKSYICRFLSLLSIVLCTCVYQTDNNDLDTSDKADYVAAPPLVQDNGILCDNAEISAEINRIRAISGLKSLNCSKITSKSAHSHCDYVKFSGSISHFENENQQFFTGYSPVERLQYATTAWQDNYTADTLFDIKPKFQVGGEVISNLTGKASLSGIYGFMNTIYHRTPFLREENIVYGLGENTSCTTIVFARCQNCKSDPPPTIVLWPPPNAFNVPTKFYQNYEIPNPLPNISSPVGYPVTIIVHRKNQNINFSIADSEKNIPIVVVSENNDDNHLVREGEFHLVPLSPLSPNTTYYITAIIDDEKFSSSFTTAK